MKDGNIFGKSIIGETLGSGWKVMEFISKKEDDSGGSYSLCYKVMKDDEEAFMKIYDFQTYVEKGRGADVADIQHKMLSHFIYERKLHDICKSGYFENVCYAIDAGSFPIQVAPAVNIPIYFLIFDKANSDMRSRMFAENTAEVGTIWRFQVLHAVATAMRQLLGKYIYHQDIKPSNVLCFDSGVYKVGDLGRSYTTYEDCPFSTEPYWGDKRYMAPEISYLAPPVNLIERAQMTDLYLFGSLIYESFAGNCFNCSLYSRLDPNLHPGKGHPYPDVLPTLVNIHEDIVKQFKESLSYPEEISTRLVACVKSLCYPDYKQRHHPDNKTPGYNHLRNIEQMISTFDYLEKRSRITLTGQKCL